jgi:sugar/nucleoside kinase (ribokinase family)
VIAVVGHTTVDHVDGSAPRSGGVPLYAARALRQLGVPGRICTRCAETDEQLLAPIRATGLEVAWRAEPVTPAFRLRYRGGAREIEIAALGEPWSPSDVDGWLGPSLRGVRWVHAGALWRGDFPPETLAALAAGGRQVALDGQGLVRRAALGPVEADGDVDGAALEHVRLLHLSEREAAVLGLAVSARSLSSLGVPEVIVTLGEDGAAVCAAGRLERVQARPVRDADPTGAGDAFTAAYVASRDAGHEPLAAARRATDAVRALLAGASA